MTEDSGYPYFDLKWFLDRLDKTMATNFRRLFADHNSLFDVAQGSSHNHQAWEGGYWDHILETLNIARRLIAALHYPRELPFTLNDAVIALLVHDLEKPFIYRKQDLSMPENMISISSSKQRRHEKRLLLLQQYDITLTPAQMNAIEYAEGESSNYTNKERHMGELAAFVHCCDVLSARMWHDRPLNEQEVWGHRSLVR